MHHRLFLPSVEVPQPRCYTCHMTAWKKLYPRVNADHWSPQMTLDRAVNILWTYVTCVLVLVKGRRGFWILELNSGCELPWCGFWDQTQVPWKSSKHSQRQNHITDLQAHDHGAVECLMEHVCLRYHSWVSFLKSEVFSVTLITLTMPDNHLHSDFFKSAFEPGSDGTRL